MSKYEITLITLLILALLGLAVLGVHLDKYNAHKRLQCLEIGHTPTECKLLF